MTGRPEKFRRAFFLFSFPRPQAPESNEPRYIDKSARLRYFVEKEKFAGLRNEEA